MDTAVHESFVNRHDEQDGEKHQQDRRRVAADVWQSGHRREREHRCREPHQTFVHRRDLTPVQGSADARREHDEIAHRHNEEAERVDTRNRRKAGARSVDRDRVTEREHPQRQSGAGNADSAVYRCSVSADERNLRGVEHDPARKDRGVYQHERRGVSRARRPRSDEAGPGSHRNDDRAHDGRDYEEPVITR